MARVAQGILLVQGQNIALEIRAIIGPLGEFATPIEIAIREAMYDPFMESHDISRHRFAVFRLDALNGRALR